MKNTYKGSCLCAAVTFKVSGFSQQVANCYCTMCRKFHGAAFGTLVQTTGLKFVTGEEHLKDYEASNGTIRTFCQQCGSSIGFLSHGAQQQEMEVAVALFDQAIPITCDAQIFTNDKANWSDLHDHIPSFKGART